MQVKDVMTRSVRSVAPDTKVIEVASLMCLYRFHGLPVVEDGDSLTRRVSELMTPNPIVVSPEMHVLRAATVMVRHRLRRIPVAENGVLLGMLSLGDVHKAIFHANVADKLKFD